MGGSVMKMANDDDASSMGGSVMQMMHDDGSSTTGGRTSVMLANVPKELQNLGRQQHQSAGLMADGQLGGL